VARWSIRVGVRPASNNAATSASAANGPLSRMADASRRRPSSCPERDPMHLLCFTTVLIPILGHASAGEWFAHMLISGFVHVAIFHLLAPIFKTLGPIGSMVLAAVIIFVGWKISQRMRAY
jgi:hypothetical protein